MDSFKQRVDELAALMDEFSLSEAKLKGEDYKIAFKKYIAAPAKSSQEHEDHDPTAVVGIPVLHSQPMAPAEPAKPAGTPVNSPMNGIFYSAPSPTAPAFVKEGEPVTAGQVVGLIEAMKVFNEIVAPISGTVDKLVAESGQLVQPGDPLLYIS